MNLIEFFKSLHFSIKCKIIYRYIQNTSVLNKNLILFALAEREIKNNPNRFKIYCKSFIKEIEKTIDK